MPSFLARYQAGDHEGVWRDLVALGDGVRHGPLHEDARAVAHETMTRARRNVETLVARLRDLGFRFAFPDEAHVPPDARTIQVLDRLEREVGPVPLSLRAFHQIVGSVCFMGSHPALSTYAEPPSLQGFVDDVQRTIDAHVAPPTAGSSPVDPLAGLRDIALPGGGSLLGALPPQTLEMMRQAMQLNQQLMARMLEVPQETERMMRTGEPSARFAETQQLAEALAGRLQPPADAGAAGPVSDPLVVSPLPFDEPDDYLVFDDEEDEEEGEGGVGRRWAIDVAPDDCHKAGQSGGGPYHVLLPDGRADAPLVDSRYDGFVAYLRESFRWGGFPGLADGPRPAELARLTEGLLPL